MKLTFSAFNEKFMPLKNDNPVKKNDYTDFILYPTTEIHINLIRNAVSQKKVWTISENEKGELFAVPGKHAYFSSLGYFVTRMFYDQHHFENLRVILKEPKDMIKNADIRYLEQLKNFSEHYIPYKIDAAVIDRVIKHLEKL